jgi:hypothetical protein
MCSSCIPLILQMLVLLDAAAAAEGCRLVTLVMHPNGASMARSSGGR